MRTFFYLKRCRSAYISKLLIQHSDRNKYLTVNKSGELKTIPRSHFFIGELTQLEANVVSIYHGQKQVNTGISPYIRQFNRQLR